MRALAEPLLKLFGVAKADDLPFVRDEELSSMGMGVVQIRRIRKATGAVLIPGQHAAPLAAAEGGQPWAGRPGHQHAHLYGSVGPDDVSEEGCVPLDVAETAAAETAAAETAVADSVCGPAPSRSMGPVHDARLDRASPKSQVRGRASV